MDANAKELIKRGDKLFGKRQSLDSLWQELADNFYPERADFTSERTWGDEFASHLFDSSPVMMRRDLGNAFSSMLRPRGQSWFELDVDDDAIRKASGVAEWLESRSDVLSRALYASTSQFVRATKETDHDFATFGNGVISCEENERRNGLRFRNHHLKDCAWVENMDGAVDTLFRNMMMSARQMKQRWGEDKLHRDIKKAGEKDPDKEFKVRHVMIPVADYEYQTRKRAPKNAEYVSVYVDCGNQHLISEAPSFEFRYVVPRWQTISGSPYAVSPAAMTAIADGRMLQSMARVLLEAGEKTVDPPMKATEEAVRGEVNLYSGGITWVDQEYDERLGPALEPILLGKQVGLGVDMLVRTQMQLREAWYLTKLNLPQQGARTAFETAQLVEEFIRASIPLFEPMETSYNSPLLDLAARILLRVGAFGPVDDIPDELSRRELTFAFSNPLQDAIKRNKVMQFQTTIGLVGAAAQLDPTAAQDIDVRESLRDAVEGSGAPAKWLRKREDADDDAAAASQADGAMQLLQGAGAAGQAAEAIGKGGQAMKELSE